MATEAEEGGGGGGGGGDLQRLLSGTDEEEEALLEALRAKARHRRATKGGGGGGGGEGDRSPRGLAGDGGGGEGGGGEGGGGERGSSPNVVKKEPRQPRDIFDVPVEDNFTRPLWIQLNTHDLLSFFNLMHHAVRKECTPATCPKMTAGPNFEFLWSEGDNTKTAPMCARDYISTMMQWAHDLTNGFNLNTEDENTFKRTYRLIWSRSFRIAMHIYWHHWHTITEMQLDGLLNAFTKHFVIFALKFRMLTSWESISAIYDLLSSILPPVYASQLQDLRDGKKKTKAPRRGSAAGRRRAHTEFQERGIRPLSPRAVFDPSELPDIAEEVPLPRTPRKTEKSAEISVGDAKGEDGEKMSDKPGSPKDEVSDESGTEKSTNAKEDSISNRASNTSGSKGSQGRTESSTANDASPLRPGCTLESSTSQVSKLNLTTHKPTDSAGTSPRREISPRDEEERRKRGSRIQLTKNDFIRELHKLKEQQEGAGSRTPSPRSPPSEGGEGSTRGSRSGSGADMTQDVLRFFTPPDSPRKEEPSSPRSPSSPSSRRSNTILQTSSASTVRSFPSLPPSFDVAKALADLSALDQEYDAFEELHELEQKLITASEQREGGENRDIYSMFQPRKNVGKRAGLISSQEFDEMRLQFQEQEKKRSRSWVTKRTSLPRDMQELKGTYISKRTAGAPQTSPRQGS